MAARASTAEIPPGGDDERLLIEAAQADPRRFGDLYERNFDRVYAYVARRTGSRGEAEDLTAEVFHQALANLGRFEWRGVPFAAWLLQIARNAVADRWQRLAREPGEPAPDPDAAGNAADADRRAVLADLVARLPRDQQRVVLARFVEQLSLREIAEALGRSEGAVKQLQFRALETTTSRGIRSVTPYLAVRPAVELIEFVKRAFGAQELLRTTGTGGGVHAEVRIGDTRVMIGGGEAWGVTPTPTGLHLYVPDVDRVYQAALEAGADSLRGPDDQPYGDRDASVKDLAGNHWYIATHLTGRHVPEGLGTVTPYLHPRGTPELIDFLKRAFAAEEMFVHRGSEGTFVLHAKIRVGGSVIEMGEAHDEWQPMPSMFYVYVDDVDAWYRRALAAGAASMEAPAVQPYGERRAAVRDAFGNQWYLAAPAT